MTASTLPLATVYGLYHIAIKTSDLAATRKFWTDIIGLKEIPRPDFGYPGAWLGCPQPAALASSTSTPADLRSDLKARRQTARPLSTTCRCPVRVIVPTSRDSRQRDSTGGSSSCRVLRYGSCLSTTRAAFN